MEKDTARRLKVLSYLVNKRNTIRCPLTPSWRSNSLEVLVLKSSSNPWILGKRYWLHTGLMRHWYWCEALQQKGSCQSAGVAKEKEEKWKHFGGMPWKMLSLYPFDLLSGWHAWTRGQHLCQTSGCQAPQQREKSYSQVCEYVHWLNITIVPAMHLCMRGETPRTKISIHYPQ